MRSSRAVISVLCLSLCLGLLAARTATADGGFVVLVNATNPVSSLRRSELKQTVLGGAKQWDNGAIVHIGIIPNDAPETKYLASLLDMTVAEFFTRIQEQVFKGEMRRPAVLRSSGDCIAFVRVDPGGLCVVSDSAPLPPEAKSLSIR